MTPLPKIDKGWTLFLDRDGVINREGKGKYINNWEEFVFSESAVEAIRIFSNIFNRIIVVTNQRGVTRGFTKPADLQVIHTNMQMAVSKAGGKIDAVYFCIDEDEASVNRKPNTGMAMQALDQFPDINFYKSIMIGDKMSDMKFGRNLGMVTIFLPTTILDAAVQRELIDFTFPSLTAFSAAMLAGKF